MYGLLRLTLVAKIIECLEVENVGILCKADDSTCALYCIFKASSNVICIATRPGGHREIPS